MKQTQIFEHSDASIQLFEWVAQAYLSTGMSVRASAVLSMLTVLLIGSCLITFIINYLWDVGIRKSGKYSKNINKL